MNRIISAVVSAIFLFGTALIAQPSKNITLRSHMPFTGKKLSNIGGFVDGMGNEYALVGTSTGLSIVDVTNPAAPVLKQDIAGPVSDWREVKTWGNYAYVTTEGGKKGLCVINLSGLPTFPAPFHFWKPKIGTDSLETIHALHIDDGYAYLYGHNISKKGIVIANLADPWNPTYAGLYDARYVHDGFVRNDTVWACQIYDGFFSVVDVSTKSAPVELEQQFTPSKFSHNSWLSTNSQYLYTTDEVDYSYLAAYDVSDITNIQEVDRVQSQNGGSGSIVHNTHIVRKGGNDYAVTSWYKDGIVITDAGRPQNLVHTGWADDNPASGGGFEGVWGVYPYLPSGTLVVSDINEGLYVYSPTYVRACYLEGTITDSICGTPLAGVKITCTAAGITDSTDLSGKYKTGTPDPGTYTVTISKPGYTTKVIPNVILSPGVVKTLNLKLHAPGGVNFTGSVTDSKTSAAVPFTGIEFDGTVDNYSFISNTSGLFSRCGLLSGTYNVTAAKWGYQDSCFTGFVVDATHTTLNLPLKKGYEDSFTFNLGWTVSGTATDGAWERGEPVGTTLGTDQANPEFDVTYDCSNQAYVTGNAGGAAGNDDVDNGYTTLTSPVFDLSTYGEAFLEYSRWFYNGGGTGSPNDTLTISITNGTDVAILEKVNPTTPGMSSWVKRSYKLSDFIVVNSNMRVTVTALDRNPGHLVEAGFDGFLVYDANPISVPAGIAGNVKTGGRSLVRPNPASHEARVDLYPGSETDRALVTVTDLAGRILINQTVAGEGSVEIPGDLGTGVYLVKVSWQSGSVQDWKLVKTN